MSFIKINSYTILGTDLIELGVEALKTRGISQFLISGLPDHEIRESKDKIRALVCQLAAWSPVEKILVNLLPTELYKKGSHLELPIALAALAVLERDSLSPQALDILQNYSFFGALSLEGHILETPLSAVLQNEPVRPAIDHRHFPTLIALWSWIKASEGSAHLTLLPGKGTMEAQQKSEASQYRIKGRYYERLWMSAASLEKSPIFMVGPPGVGKSALARWAENLLGPSSKKVLAERKRIWSLAHGQISRGEEWVIKPHLRNHLSEFIGVVDKKECRPGFFSLSHGGLLILDEFLEINRDCREVLRTILDEKKIIRNVGRRFVELPAHFWLIATSNPCPCGFLSGEETSRCRCRQSVILDYRARLSGPIMDRFAVKLFIDRHDFPIDEVVWSDWALLDDPEALHKRLRLAHQALSEAKKESAHYLQKKQLRFRSERSALQYEGLFASLATFTGASFDKIFYFTQTKGIFDEKYFHAAQNF